MSARLTLYGPTVSTFTRICAMAAAEADLIGTLSRPLRGRPKWPRIIRLCARRQPILTGCIFAESPAICSYIDRRHNGGALHPDDAEAQARMWQWTNIAAHYVFPVTEERLVLPRVVAPLMGRQADETKIAEALPIIDYHLQQVDKRLADSRFLAGDAVSLADLFMYPVIDATCAALKAKSWSAL